MKECVGSDSRVSKKTLWKLAPLIIGICGSLLIFSKTSQPTKTSDLSETDIVATVGNHPITLRQAERQVALPLYQLNEQRSQLLLYAVQQLIDAELLRIEASRSGKTVEQLVTDYPSELPSNTARPIQATLLNAEQTMSFVAKRQAILVALRRQASIQINVPRTPGPDVTISADDDPSTGPTTAPVTIIEFSDFECPFCKRSADVVKEILRAYGDKIRFVYRDYPAPNHIHARAAAEAAQCAAAQGQFWPFHDLLFQHQQAESGWDFNRLAQQTSMDMSEFSHCVETHQYAREVENDLRDALNVGITSTPTFFINGRPLVGARSLEEFQFLIDTALANHGSARPTP